MAGTNGLDGSDAAPFTERRRAGMPPGTFKAIIAIVVVLLLINVYALYLLVDFPQGEVEDGDGNGDGEPEFVPPWNRKIEPLEIFDEMVWEGLEGPLERPVRVMDGGHLILRDSDIQLLHDDMLWFNGTYFDVEPGGALEIVDSTIDVVSSELDPNILIGPYSSGYTIPVIHRVVNLAGTSEPLLSFDLQWRFNGTPLTVALQPTPESAIMTLEELDPQGPCPGWEHHEYNLGFYVGTTPRIVIYLPEYPDDVFMIKDLNVTDGGKDLPFDLPHNVSARVSGWTAEAFHTYDMAFRYLSVHQTIVDSEGDVHISGSTLKVPIEHMRWGGSDYDKERHMYRWFEQNWWSSVGGMEIRTNGGDLTIEGSYLENVPVEGNNSLVSVQDTRFSSGYDMLTLNASYGVVDGSTFEFTGIGEGLHYWDEDNGRALWAISIENNEGMEPVVVTDCQFLNVQQAIDLSYSKVSIDGCVFQGVTRLAIWDHMSGGIDSWEGLVSGNTFRSCTGHLYLKTIFSEITVNGTIDSWRSLSVLDTEGEVIKDFGVHRTLGSLMDHDTGIRSLYRPQLLVETEQRVRHVDFINITFYGEVTSPWNAWGRVNFSIPSSAENIHLELFPLLEEQVDHPWEPVRAPTTIKAILPLPEYAANAYMLAIKIYTKYLYALNVTFDVYLDHRLLDTYNETEILGLLEGASRVNLYPIVYFEPGPHELDLVVSGNVILDEYNISEERTDIENATYRLMRATAHNTSEEVRDFLGDNGVYLLLDEGVSFDLDGLEPSNETADYHHFIISAMNNTSLVLRNMDYPENMRLNILYEQPMNITIVDSDLSSLTIHGGEFTGESPYYSYLEDPYDIISSLTIENSTLASLELYMTLCAIRIIDTTVNSGLWISVQFNGTLEMTNSDVVDSYYSMVQGPLWSLSVKDCTFSGRGYSGCAIDATSMVNISIEDTSFMDFYLTVSVKEWKPYDWELVVTGCKFEGTDNFLSINWDFQEGKYWRDYPSTFPVPTGTIEGNTFSGPESGLVLHHDLFDGPLGDNELMDGASIWAWYMPSYVTIPLEEGYQSGTHDTIFGTETYKEEFPFLEYRKNDDGHYYLDVTDDPSIALDPAPFLVVIRWNPPHSYYFVAGFGELDLTEDSTELLFPIWPDLQGTLTEYIEDWPWPMEHYSGPRW